MMVFTLKRWDMSLVDTLGYMKNDDGNFRCLTMERPWKNNASDVSCIPKGEYSAKLFNSAHFGFPVWQLQNVPGRDFIEIHPANLVTQLEGCIALGYAITHFSQANEDIENSKDAFNHFMEITQNQVEIKIVIDEV